MTIKYTYMGLLVYLAMGSYLLAFITTIIGEKKAGWFVYSIAASITAMAFAYRWFTSGHIPFQSMFEVFLSMGVVIFPLSVFCKRFLKVGVESTDMLIGFILLFPAGFIFSADPQKLPPALQCWLFIPHVAVYLLSYVIMFKAAVQAFCRIAGRKSDLLDYEQATYRMITLGFPLLTLGLILGSIWGKLAWGDYWNWDPKESWSLASWLIYVEYFHFRHMFGKKYPRTNCMFALLGLAAILITLIWVNLSNIFAGLHNYAS